MLIKVWILALMGMKKGASESSLGVTVWLVVRY
jgi:hypothetical protein